MTAASKAYREGRRASRAGQARTNNPYLVAKPVTQGGAPLLNRMALALRWGDGHDEQELLKQNEAG